jgi:hypothetical protein
MYENPFLPQVHRIDGWMYVYEIREKKEESE